MRSRADDTAMSPNSHRDASFAHDRAPVTRRLQREWDRLRLDAESLRTVNRWRVLADPVTDLDELLTAIGHRSADPLAEVRLRRVVQRAATEPFAARVVLQRLLAGIIAMAVRRCRRSPGSSLNELINDLVSAVWIEVRTFNPSRQPNCLAAALLRDAEHRIVRPLMRQQHHLELVDTTIAAEAAPAPIVELAAIVGRSRLTSHERELLRQLLLGGTTGAAAALGVSTRMARYRRQHLVERLRASA